MRHKIPYFALIDAGKTVAVIQAPNKTIAKERCNLIGSHIVKVRSGCRAKRVDYRGVRHAPVFSEDFFLPLEEALSQSKKEEQP